MQTPMKTPSLHRIGVPAAACLMALMALACLALAVATAAFVGGAPGVAAAGVVAIAAFELLRGPVGRAASRLIDG